MQAGATGRIGGSQGGLRSMGGPLTGSYSRSRGSREDLPSSGSRSGRRTADPLAEAERKAQQEKMYALDYERVMAGEILSALLLGSASVMCTVKHFMGCMSFQITATMSSMRHRVIGRKTCSLCHCNAVY